MSFTGGDGAAEAPGGQTLTVRVTGELVAITGTSAVEVHLRRAGNLAALLDLLAREAHPWFGELARPDPAAVPHGPVLVLLNGRRLLLPRDLDLPLEPGELYLIPPITGG